MSNSDFVNGASFFGFMGVSMALVLASTFHVIKTSEPLMVQPRQELESAASPFGDHPS